MKRRRGPPREEYVMIASTLIASQVGINQPPAEVAAKAKARAEALADALGILPEPEEDDPPQNAPVGHGG